MDLSLRDTVQVFFSGILLIIGGWIGVWYVIKYHWHFKPPISPRWKIYVYIPFGIIYPFVLGIYLLYKVIYE